VFGALTEGFRRIVADVPTQLNDMTMGALGSASHIVLVVGDDPSDLMTVPSLLQSISELRLPGHQHIVINRTRPSGVSHEQVQHAVNQPVTADIPYEPAQVQALAEGTPLVMSRPDSLFSRAVLYLARQL
jgi:MinD-like ATPase involved in chromosome partitioning or flagellar assembly